MIQPPSVWRPSFSFPPSLEGGGISFPPLPRPLWRKSGPRSLQILGSKYPSDEGRPWSLWPLSWLSSLAPYKASGPTSLSEVGRLVLLVAGPGSRSALPSSSSPRRVMGKYIKRFPGIMRIKHMTCQYEDLPNSRVGTVGTRGPRLNPSMIFQT